MKNPLWACSALAISNQEIILIGGKNTNRNGEVHMFNIVNKTWKQLHNMNQLRVSHKSFYLPAPNQNKIYVIGGDYEMSCEVYDVKENKWSFISSYNTLLGNSLYSFSSAMAVSSASE
jgi:6-phosphogluconolactonase (cycloisomerase 2 family)